MEMAFSLGSNQGDRLQFMCMARDALINALDADGLEYAPLYETEPVGVRPEYADVDFLNTVVVLQTAASPQAWLDETQRIEDTLGRQRYEDRYAPRSIDIDVIYAGDVTLDSRTLQVPHPRWMNRRFVLQPLADLRAGMILPGAGGLTVRQLLDDLDDAEKVWIWKREW